MSEVLRCIQHSIGPSSSFTSIVQLFNDSIIHVQIIFFFLIILTKALASIILSGATFNPSIMNHFQVKKIPHTLAFHNSISISLGSSIQVTIFSILSVI
jgi:hypothetical protein